MAATRKTSKRPPKSWWRHCVNKVRDSSTAVSPESVCGGNWYHKMTEMQRKRAKRTHKD